MLQPSAVFEIINGDLIFTLYFFFLLYILY